MKIEFEMIVFANINIGNRNNAIYLLYDVFTSMPVLEYHFFNRLHEFSDSLAIK